MGGDPDTPVTNPTGWNLVLNEQFADLNNWNCTWNNLVVFDTTIHQDNAAVNAGTLRITGEYEAGVTNIGSLLDTKATYTYGFFECRAKVPAGQGLFPAFWLYGVADPAPKPEIDIFESIGDGNLYIANHFEGSPQNSYSMPATLSDDYHIYSAKWENGKCTFFFDNYRVVEFLTGIPSTPLNVMIDLYIGGSWAGDPPPEVTFPVYFDVDYIKVWQKAA